MSSRNKADVKKLLEFWCEVTRAHGVDRSTRSGAAAPTGIIVESFPESFRDEKTKADIPAFAFPCDFSSDSVQLYSFVLTTDDSKWRYGFCRHDPKTDSAMVIITYLPWHNTFQRLLSVLADLRTSNNNEFRTFLSEAYNRGVPDPGSSLTLRYNGSKSTFVFERPLQFQLPSIPENIMLSLYYNFADAQNMIGVFAAMLAERRIIFTSRHLDRLSACIQAANSFLYPMVWQHIFIPVLPMKLKDYLSAPMPYLIGVPEIVLETMTPDELGEVVILYCDKKIFESPFDDVHEMPAEIVSQLKKYLSHSSEHVGDRISKIFLGVLVQLIGGYRDAVEFRGTGKTFNPDKFIETRPAHLRPFLTKMMELQIFQQFIDERIDMLNTGLGFSDEFEMETVRYAEKMKKRGKNYAFLKNVKDKTNPAVKSAVRSVKEGSRGVKTAYKDLKSKIRDITPPSSNNKNFLSHLPTTNSQHDHIDGYVGSSGKSFGGRHSAPSSPIFNKRSHYHSPAVGFKYASPSEINGATHAIRKAPPLAMSSSSSHIQPNGYANFTPDPAHQSHHLATSPTVSPASSLCSSEMNLSQELQNHPLFKSPIVDRSSLRSLQPHHLQTTQTTAGSFNVVASEADTMNDLISLDDSNNTSFDLEDFDPLNSNARPLPPLNKHGGAGKKSTTLPTGTSPALILPATGVSNPIYPYYTPQHSRPPLLPPTTKPPPPPTDIPSYDDDFELLRKYGLDQFKLTTSVSATATPSSKAFRNNNHGVTPGSNMMQSATTTSASMNNWTTFD